MRATQTAFGRSMRSARLKRGLSQQDVADACGTSKALISRIEIERLSEGASARIIANVARLLGLNVLEMLRLTRKSDYETWKRAFEEAKNG